MAELAGGTVWRIQGTTITLPLRFPDAEMAPAVFLANSRPAAGLLRDTGLRPLSLAGRALSVVAGCLPVPFGIRGKGPLWSRLNRGAQAGVLLRGAMSISMHGVRAGRGRAHVQLGDHPMAAKMAALGMTGRPLLTLHARHLTGELDAFRPVRDPREPRDGAAS
jgi:hypothetical protein